MRQYTATIVRNRSLTATIQYLGNEAIGRQMVLEKLFEGITMMPAVEVEISVKDVELTHFEGIIVDQAIHYLSSRHNEPDPKKNDLVL